MNELRQLHGLPRKITQGTPEIFDSNDVYTGGNTPPMRTNNTAFFNWEVPYTAVNHLLDASTTRLYTFHIVVRDRAMFCGPIASQSVLNTCLLSQNDYELSDATDLAVSVTDVNQTFNIETANITAPMKETQGSFLSGDIEGYDPDFEDAVTFKAKLVIEDDTTPDPNQVIADVLVPSFVDHPAPVPDKALTVALLPRDLRIESGEGKVYRPVRLDWQNIDFDVIAHRSEGSGYYPKSGAN